jgi:hypothetical protein
MAFMGKAVLPKRLDTTGQGKTQAATETYKYYITVEFNKPGRVILGVTRESEDMIYGDVIYDPISTNPASTFVLEKEWVAEVDHIDIDFTKSLKRAFEGIKPLARYWRTDPKIVRKKSGE